jgi:hypothetical protein
MYGVVPVVFFCGGVGGVFRYEFVSTTAMYVAATYTRPAIVQWLLGRCFSSLYWACGAKRTEHRESTAMILCIGGSKDDWDRGAENLMGVYLYLLLFSLCPKRMARRQTSRVTATRGPLRYAHWDESRL